MRPADDAVRAPVLELLQGEVDALLHAVRRAGRAALVELGVRGAHRAVGDAGRRRIAGRAIRTARGMEREDPAAAVVVLRLAAVRVVRLGSAGCARDDRRDEAQVREEVRAPARGAERAETEGARAVGPVEREVDAAPGGGEIRRSEQRLPGPERDADARLALPHRGIERGLGERHLRGRRDGVGPGVDGDRPAGSRIRVLAGLEPVERPLRRRVVERVFDEKVRAEVRTRSQQVPEHHLLRVQVRRQLAPAARGALARRVVAREALPVTRGRPRVGDQDDDLVGLVEVVRVAELAPGRGLAAREDAVGAEAPQRDDDVRVGPALPAGWRRCGADLCLIQQTPVGQAAQGLDSRLEDRRESPGQRDAELEGRSDDHFVVVGVRALVGRGRAGRHAERP